MNFHPQAVRHAKRYAAAFSSVALLAANTSEQVFAPGSNTAGAVLWRASGATGNGTGIALLGLTAHTAAPNNLAVGDLLASSDAGTPTHYTFLKVEHAIYIPAGKGLYWTTNFLETAALRSALYTLLS